MRVWTFGLLISAVVGIGCCEEKKPPPDPSVPVPTASALATLGVDASVLGDPTDPPSPAGDLKADLDRFVNVDTCVSERAKLDPLVGDALGALGYDTFLRDACRLLEAAKDKKRETCDRIDSSALRARCQSWVAMIAQTPDACPLQFEGLITRGRNALCVAVAARDPRLCTGEGRATQRSTCEALVARDPAKCEGLLPNQRAQCQREVARWHAVLAPPLEGLEKLAPIRGKLLVKGVSGTPDPAVTEVDLAPDFVRGVVVVTGRSTMPGGQRTRIELGTVVESEARKIAASPQKKPRVGLAVLLDVKPDPKKDASSITASLQKLELELPGSSPLVSPPVPCDCKVTVKTSGQRGAEVALKLEGTVNASGLRYEVTVDLVTFVRDVVAEQPETRVLPITHPALPSRLDGGR